MIIYTTFDVKMPVFPKRIISSWIKEISEKYQKKVGNISYIFCSDEKILEMNKEYLSHDYFTDIITFDYTSNNRISGDIFISIDTVLSNSIFFNVPYDKELFRVMIHGILHLCAFNDNTKEKRIEMRNSENDALNILYTAYIQE